MGSSTVDLEWNVAEAERAAAIILHPHPDFGGDRLNPVVDALFRRLPTVGVSAARFDFSSSDPAAAAADTRAAIDDAAASSPNRPLILAGYSFGADVAATVVDARLAGWFLVALPLRLVAPEELGAASDGRPKGVAVPRWDQYSPPDRVYELTAGWRATTITVIDGADHFLAGAASRVGDAAALWVGAVLTPSLEAT